MQNPFVSHEVQYDCQTVRHFYTIASSFCICAVLSGKEVSRANSVGPGAPPGTSMRIPILISFYLRLQREGANFLQTTALWPLYRSPLTHPKEAVSYTAESEKVVWSLRIQGEISQKLYIHLSPGLGWRVILLRLPRLANLPRVRQLRVEKTRWPGGGRAGLELFPRSPSLSRCSANWQQKRQFPCQICHRERARLSTNDRIQWSSRKRPRNLCLIKFIEFSQHYKQLITVIFPTDDSIPQYHLRTEHLLAMASANPPPPWCQKQ